MIRRFPRPPYFKLATLSTLPGSKLHHWLEINPVSRSIGAQTAHLPFQYLFLHGSTAHWYGIKFAKS